MIHSTRAPTSLPQTNLPHNIHTRPVAPDVYVKPKLTTEDAAKLLITKKIHDRHLDGTTNILYEFFSNSQSDNMHYHSTNELNANQKDQTRRALQAWGDLTNLTFTELPKPTPSDDVEVLMGKHSHNDHRIVFGQTSGEGDYSSHGELPGYRHSSIAMIGMSTTDPDFGHDSYRRGVLTRVIGYAIGLSTPLQIKTDKYVDINGTLQGDSAFHDKDNLDYTVMSPHRGENSVISEHSRPSEYLPNYVLRREENRPVAAMMHDIAAIQKLYGANVKTRNTDTTYGFNSNSDRDFLSLNSAQDKAIFCVWDGGGNDTLDFSGFSQNQKINLYERSFSDVGGMKGNVSIAKGVTLENAVGGAGDDLLIGNHADNRLKGGNGADRLEGGNGADTFEYDNASESTPDKPDLITDFTSGVDKIDLSGALRNSGVSGLNFVKTYSGKPGDTVLNYDPQSGHGSLAVDLTGNGQADLLIKTVGRIQSGDVLTSTHQKPSHTAPKMHKPPSKVTPLNQTSNSAGPEAKKEVTHVALANGTKTSGIYSQIPDTGSRTTVVSVKDGNWNHTIEMPKNPRDSDLVIINSTTTPQGAFSHIISRTANDYTYLSKIEPGQKTTFKYSANTQSWQRQDAGVESQWVGSKILLGTSHSVVSLDHKNWRPEARLPSEAVDGDIVQLRSNAELPINVTSSNVNTPMVWQLTKGDSLDFQYSAKNEAWELVRKPGQFYSAHTLAEGVLPPPSSWRTYVEVANGNWQDSITLPTKNVQEGHQVIIKTTADQRFKVKSGHASYTIESGETVSFKAGKDGRYVRELAPAKYLDYAYARSNLKHFENDGIWRNT